MGQHADKGSEKRTTRTRARSRVRGGRLLPAVAGAASLAAVLAGVVLLSEGAASGAKPKGSGRTGRPPKVEGAKHNVLSIRGTAEWRAWLGRLSEHCRLKSADVIDRALIAYAKVEGFAEPAPRR